MLRSEIPRGTRVLLPVMAAKKRRLEELLLTVFFRWGFQEVVLPTFEYMDVLTLGLGEAYKERMFKLEERRTGRMLSLRPDLTTQIAKLSATLLKDQARPLRFCYVANIFRHNDSQTRNLQELCRSVLAEAGLCEEERKLIQAALQKKDTSTLETLVAQCPITDHSRHVLLQIPSLFGKTEVLHRAANLSQSRGAQAALANLAQVYDMLKTYGLEDRVLIDLSDIRGFNYYTGITFEGFTSTLGYGVCSGGRYDHLVGCYGPSDPSTGFAIDLEALLEALAHANPLPARSGADCLLMDFRKDKRDALRISRELRRRGHRVARDIITRDLQGSLDYAKRTGIRYGLLMGLAPLTDDEAMLHDVVAGTAERLALADIIDYVDAAITRLHQGAKTS